MPQSTCHIACMHGFKQYYNNKLIKKKEKTKNIKVFVFPAHWVQQSEQECMNNNFHALPGVAMHVCTARRNGSS